uniref:Uncharacterized protein n=1 Tax=Oryza punctata TaxID=4537 RepID=A0A0E0LHJ7_ORYPU
MLAADERAPEDCSVAEAVATLGRPHSLAPATGEKLWAAAAADELLLRARATAAAALTLLARAAAAPTRGCHCYRPLDCSLEPPSLPFNGSTERRSHRLSQIRKMGELNGCRSQPAAVCRRSGRRLRDG